MEEGKRKENPVSLDEQRYIQNNLEGASLFAIAMLGRVRTRERNVDEVLKGALEEPGNEEHSESWQKAADFLRENSDRFNIQSSKE